jgi:hypothetical protein
VTNKAHAAVVRRIFMDFAAGTLPKKIASKEGIPDPAGTD